MVAGTFSISIIRRAPETARRIAGRSAAVAWRAMSGSAAVAIDTPKRPIGKYIRRKAALSQETAPCGSLDARIVFTTTLIWYCREPERARTHQPEDFAQVADP